MCRTSVCRFLLGACSNPGSPKSQSGSDGAEASRLVPPSAASDVKRFSELEFDHGDREVNAQSWIDGSSASLDADAKRISLPFNRQSVHPDTFCAATASYPTHPLFAASSFDTTSFLASCLFGSREHRLNHALLPIGSFHPPPPSEPPPDSIVSPVRHTLGLGPETLWNMPSLQPGTANEERTRRREATRHQEKSRFTNVLRQADASVDTTPATAPQSRSNETRSKRTGNVKVAQTRDKVAPGPSTRPVDEHPEPDSLKSTVTPVFWDNPLKTLPHIYNPSPIGRPANHAPAKPSATSVPRMGGRAQGVAPRSSAESVRARPRPSADTHGTAQAGVKFSSKRPVVPAPAGSKSASASADQSSRSPAAAAPPPSTALRAVQPLPSHPSTTVVQTSTESLPMTGSDLRLSAACASSPQKGTRSKAVSSTSTTERAGRSMKRLEEWHEKRVNTRYPTRQEIHEKLIKVGHLLYLSPTIDSPFCLSRRAVSSGISAIHQRLSRSK